MLPAHKLTDHKYLIFDVYATLIDWETGLHNALKPLLSRFPSASRWSRGEALRAFQSVEIDLQAQHPSMLYSGILAKAHEVLEARLIAAEGRSSATGDSTSTLEGNPTSVNISTEPSSSTSQPVANVHTVFGDSIKRWAPFPDSAGALHDLSTHFKLIVLSNVDHTSFSYSHAYLSEGTSPTVADDHDGNQQPLPFYTRPSPNPHPRDLWLPQQTPNSKSPFSLIMTAQDTGVYKPAPEGFLAVFEAIRTEPSLFAFTGPTVDDVKSQVLIVAQSLTHDHEPARRLGVRSVWIDRKDATLRPEGIDDDKDPVWKWRFETLGDMAQAVKEELRGAL